MTELLDAARDLRSQLDAEGAKAEVEGTPLTDAAVTLCRDAGLFAPNVPQAVGGGELAIGDSLDVFSELARADGSVGWVAMAVSTATAFFGAYTPDSFADVMFADRVPVVAGQFAPNGIAVPTDAGYSISGDFSFGSGIEHADWVGCGSLTAPESGDPDYLIAAVPRDEVELAGNWEVMGLRSTASYDYRIDHVVPVDRTFSFGGFERHRGGPMYELGVIGLTEVGHAGWILGVLRRAIDEATAIAEGKKRMTGKTVLAEDPRFQYDLAWGESRLRSGELWIRSAFDRAERSVVEGRELDQAAIAEAMQATTFLTQEAAAIVQSLYLHIGTSALREGAFQRCFRDIHAGSQHAMVSPMNTYAFAGGMLAGAEESALDM